MDMENELNNRFLNTVSMKMYKGSFIIQHVFKKIIDSQNIRRYIFYCSQNPLSTRGLMYDGKTKVDQPDLTEKQVEKHITDLPFSKEMDLELNNQIFISLPVGNFNNRNEIIVEVNLVTALSYYRITEGYRNIQIACEIANEIADKYVDGIYMGDLGDGLKIEFLGCNTERLSKTNEYLLTTLGFKVTQPKAFERVKK